MVASLYVAPTKVMISMSLSLFLDGALIPRNVTIFISLLREKMVIYVKPRKWLFHKWQCVGYSQNQPFVKIYCNIKH